MKGSRGQGPNSREPRTTIYRGIAMRSRLEALVAAYLDRHGFVWQYEPVCFAGMQGQYLPDFRIQRSDNADVYLEVKPKPEKLATMVYQQVQRM